MRVSLAVLLSTVLNAWAGDLPKVGYITPMSGPRALFGADAQDGVTLAFEHLRKQGEQPLFSLSFEDSQGDPQKGVSAYRKLLHDHVKLVITQNSNVSMAIAPLTAKSEVIQLGVTTTADAYSSPHDNTFRLNGALRPEADVLADALKESFDSDSKVAIFTLEDQYPMSLRGNLLAVLSERGIAPKVDELFGPEESDFRTILTKAKSTGCTHFVFLAYATQGGVLIKQLREIIPSAKFRFGNSSVRGADFFEAAGPAADGVLVSFMDVDHGHPAAREFKDRFKKEVSNTSANAYDAVFIVQRVFRECQNDLTAACLKPALFKVKDYNGLSGRKSFDDVNGDMADRYIVKVAEGGTFVNRT